MKQKFILFLCSCMMVCSVFFGCAGETEADIVATTRPVYDFTAALCQGTGLNVQLLVTESMSCLHDYTLQVRQMRAVERAGAIVMSGAGLEDFLQDVLANTQNTIDASAGISLLCSEHEHNRESEHQVHHHENDPHIWLSIQNARCMANNICNGLQTTFPECKEIFAENLLVLNQKLDALYAYGQESLSVLSCRELITFHNGFSYLAEEWGLTIAKALEEESGSEASAAELKELITLVRENKLPAIFTEENGSTCASDIVSRETGIPIYSLSMVMSETDYFTAMYHNIDTLKEALG